MSVSNLYATASNGSKFIKQDKIEVDNLIVDTTLIINGGTVINDGVTIYGRDNPNVELNMNFDANALACIGSTTGMNFETIDKELGSVICENSSATAGSVIASKISIKPAIPNGATPVISDMLSVGKDLLTTELGVFAKSAFGAGVAGALGITNIENYASASTGKVYKFSLPSAGGSDVLTLVADQIAPSAGAGSPPAVVSSKNLMTIAPDGPASAPTSYSVAIGDITDATPLVAVQGSAGVGQIYDSRYNLPAKNLQYILVGPGANLLVSGGPVNIVYTPQQTGLYLFSFVIELNSTATIGTDDIEYSLDIGAGAPNCNTIKNTSISPFTGGRNNIYSWTNPVFLTAGTPYQFTATAYGTGWQVPIFAWVSALC
jgi:hypothetical protein